MLEMRVSKPFARSGSYKGVKRFMNQALAILKEGQEQGVIRQDLDIHLTRHLLLGTLEHVVTRWLLKGEKEDIMLYHEQLSDLILNGVAIHSGNGFAGTTGKLIGRNREKGPGTVLKSKNVSFVNLTKEEERYGDTSNQIGLHHVYQQLRNKRLC